MAPVVRNLVSRSTYGEGVPRKARTLGPVGERQGGVSAACDT